MVSLPIWVLAAILSLAGAKVLGGKFPLSVFAHPQAAAPDTQAASSKANIKIVSAEWVPMQTMSFHGIDGGN